VAELIEAEGGSCVLAGHDWGAAAAWYLAMTRPELVRRLVILNVPHPAAIARELRRSFRQKINLAYQVYFQLPFLPELTMRLLGRTFLRRAARFSEEEIETCVRQWKGRLTPMLNYYRAVFRMRGELRRLARRIDVPVLLIRSEAEPVFLPAAFEDLGRWVTNVRLEQIAGVGHFVQHDAWARVNELVVEFAEVTGL